MSWTGKEASREISSTLPTVGEDGRTAAIEPLDERRKYKHSKVRARSRESIA